MTAPRRRPAAFWVTPAVSVALGVAMGAAGWAGGQRWFAVFAVVLMSLVAVCLVAGARRSETVKGLLDGRDERISALDRDATLVAGTVVLAALLAGFVWELSRGGDGQPYSWIAALGGLSYVVALVWLRVRR